MFDIVLRDECWLLKLNMSVRWVIYLHAAKPAKLSTRALRGTKRPPLPWAACPRPAGPPLRMGLGPPCKCSPVLVPAGLRHRLAVPSPVPGSLPYWAGGAGHPGRSHVPRSAWPHLPRGPHTHAATLSLLLPTGLWSWLVTLSPLGLSVVPASHLPGPDQSSLSERARCCLCCGCPEPWLALPRWGSAAQAAPWR